ncbi:MAG TPA: YccF domain-containing protein [Porphyromonadaceae bacterium]|jgi:membrane protein|uniref:YccF domain-containing protein n=1 Tax=Candidatus Caccoplasma intestinavium TaxID=2840716 RepID=A0A9D1GE55_9BACT|nr:YccF domain-containing protein [Coprobacter sp.]HCZ21229.1 YccF domain-containing protein [Porphyromonadaceae bacterium]HIT39186.1 YccF domain-containing protein [Candidatus Caccoplasma intestinavium]
MSVLGNIIWLVFGGFFMALEYLVSGFLLCCTIIGIPFGLQVFKIGLVALLPFSQTTVVEEGSRSCLEIIMNVIWFFIGGIWIALSHLGWGLLFCITIVGIPFGIQHFKLMRVALFPFGRTVIPS